MGRMDVRRGWTQSHLIGKSMSLVFRTTLGLRRERKGMWYRLTGSLEQPR